MATIKPSEYTITFSSEFIFDTNIWLLLYGNVADYQKNDQNEYSRLLSEAISRKSSIYITTLILSEFANVLLRLEFNIWKKTAQIIEPDYKRDFVGTAEYQKAVLQISKSIKSILALPNIIRLPDQFNTVDINSILSSFKVVDFNDSFICELSKIKNLAIVSNDTDFKQIIGSQTLISTK